LPFVLLMLDMDATRPIPAGLRIYIGALAGLGTMIKPHFALLVPALLAWRALRARSAASLWAAEGASFAILVSAALGWFLLIWRDWLHVTTWARDLYWAYDVPSFRWLWPNDSRLLVALFAAVTVVGLSRALRAAAAGVTPLFLACTYSLLVFIQQWKGFTYQLIPFSVFLFVLVALLFVSSWSEDDPPERMNLARLLLVCLALSAGIGVQHLTTPGSPTVTSLRRADPLWTWLAARPAGESVAIFSTNVAGAFPAVTYSHVKWASRYPCLWPLPGIVRARDGSRAAGYRRRFIRSVVEDLEGRHAEWVLVDTYDPQQGAPRGVRILDFLESDSEFRRVWSTYHAAGSQGGMLVFKRA